jgi:hypothetical protein
MDMTKIEKLDSLLDTIICASNTEQEIRSDTILYDVLEILKSENACKQIVGKHRSCTGIGRSQNILKSFRAIADFFRIGLMVCNSRSSRDVVAMANSK